MRSHDEILARIKALETDPVEDLFGFQRMDLIACLPFELAKPYLVEGTTSEGWTPEPMAEAAVKARMLDYMPFAWEKANDCRGLSASRSVEHFKAWLWLLGDELAGKLDGMYQFYGKPCLKSVCEKYGWDWTQWDDGKWRNDQNGPALTPEEACA